MRPTGIHVTPLLSLTPISQVAARCQRTIERICEQCGVVFLAEPRRISAGRARFCSRVCVGRSVLQARRRAVGQVGSNNPHWKGGISRHPYHYTLAFRKRFPHKFLAQRVVAQAVLSGRLARPTWCEDCSRACRPHGHHDDYSKPLSVRWLCGPCHRAIHALGLKVSA